ncbi:unnamed protein product [Clavelina lepadiformis]|uniref:ADP-ribosylation factor-like protein 16 n=1 Tax=Clavelina lepadiformis TaxID=159417 RepID=A0ABP0FWT1_CLALP
MILVLGPSGCGKSTLVKVLSSFLSSNKLKSSSKNDLNEFEELPSTVPTIGTNITTVNIGKRNMLELREVGGSMVPIWKSYYKDARGFIFIIDASNSYQISCASIQLQKVLDSPDTEGKPVLVVFNKTDIPTKSNLNEMKYLSQLDEISRNSSQVISVVETSCREKNRFSDIIKWLQTKKH